MAKKRKGPNKMALVRDAIAALGGNPKPKAIAEQIKAASGESISPGMISSYKSMILRKGKKKRGPGRPPKAAGGRPGRPAGGGSVSMDDMMAVKGMISRFGPKKLSDLINLLAN